MLDQVDDYSGLSNRALLGIMVAIAGHFREIAQRRRMSAVADAFDTAAHIAERARRKHRQKIEA